MFHVQTHVCRICLSPTNETAKRFDDSTLAHVLEEWFSIQPLNDDKMPRNICVTCHDTIVNVLNLQTTCHKSTALLKKYLEAPVAKTFYQFKQAIDAIENNIRDGLTVTFDDTWQIQSVTCETDGPLKEIAATMMNNHEKGDMTGVEVKMEPNDNAEIPSEYEASQPITAPPFLLVTKLEDDSYSLEFGVDDRPLTCETNEYAQDDPEWTPADNRPITRIVKRIKCPYCALELCKDAFKLHCKRKHSNVTPTVLSRIERVKCEHCDMEVSRGAYLRHIKRRHSGRENKRAKQSVDSPSKVTRATHDSDVEPTVLYRNERVNCQHCDMEVSRSAYLRHVKRRHSGRENKRAKKSVDSPPKATRVMHHSNVEPTVLYRIERVKCEHCDMEVSRGAYLRHIKRRHSGRENKRAKQSVDSPSKVTRVTHHSNVTPTVLYRDERVNCVHCGVEVCRGAYLRHIKRRHCGRENKRAKPSGVSPSHDGAAKQINCAYCREAIAQHMYLRHLTRNHGASTNAAHIKCAHCNDDVTIKEFAAHVKREHPQSTGMSKQVTVKLRPKLRVICAYCDMELAKDAYPLHVKRKHAPVHVEILKMYDGNASVVRENSIIDAENSTVDAENWTDTENSAIDPDKKRRKRGLTANLRIRCAYCDMDLCYAAYSRHLRRQHPDMTLTSDDRDVLCVNADESKQWRPTYKHERMNCALCNMELSKLAYALHLKRRHANRDHVDDDGETVLPERAANDNVKCVRCEYCSQDVLENAYGTHMVRKHGRPTLSSFRSQLVANGFTDKLLNEEWDKRFLDTRLLTWEEIHRLLGITDADEIFCRLCEYLTTRGAIAQHYADVHVGERFNEEDYRVSSFGRIPSENRGFLCNVCFQPLRDEAVARHLHDYHKQFHRLRRVQMMHVTPMTACQLCERPVTVGRLKHHMRVVHQVRDVDFVVSCPMCQTETRSLCYRNHILRKHAERLEVLGMPVAYRETGVAIRTRRPAHMRPNRVRVVCPECGKMYPRCLLNIHIRNTHQKVDGMAKLRFTCSQCDKQLGSKESLVMHMRMHSDERPYACPHCPQRFRRRSTLYNHVPLHTGERRYTCEICAKAFIQRVSYVSHMRQHTGSVGTHECRICGAKLTASSYKKHLATHLVTSPRKFEMGDKRKRKRDH